MNQGIKDILQLFLKELKTIFQQKLNSLIIYGSVTLGDFRPGKGDIDFMVVLKENITDMEIERIVSFHEKLRNNQYGILGAQLEGSYYTKNMFFRHDKKSRGYYIGTNRRGWREINQFLMGPYDRRNIIEQGIVFYGEDMKNMIDNPSLSELKRAFKVELKNRIELIQQINDSYLLIDSIHLTLRGIALYEIRRIVSKTEALNLYRKKIVHEPSNDLILQLALYRYPFSKDELKVINKNNQLKFDVLNWLMYVHKNYI